MSTVWINLAAGLAQVLVPWAVSFVESKGWLPTGGVATVLSFLAAAAASGVTTQVVKPK